MVSYIKATIFSLILAVPALSIASPFLNSAPYPEDGAQPTSFTVTIDGNTVTVPVYQDPADNQVRLKYNLAGITNGAKSVTIVAVNSWGSSQGVLYHFDAGAPATPTGFYISKD